MNKRLLDTIARILIDHAKSEKVITYGELSKKLDNILPPLALNNPLGTLSEICFNNELPPISAIVINQDTGMPGEGYYIFIGELMGHPNLKNQPSKWPGFFEETRDAVFAFDNWEQLFDLI